MDAFNKLMITPRVKELIKIVDEIPKDNVHRVLDLGCGSGFLTHNLFMEKFDAEFYGMTIGETGAALAQKKGIITFNKDLNTSKKLEFEDNYFDLIFAGEIIEHLIDPDTFLEEIHRVLAEGGILILTTPNLASWYNRILLLFGYQPFLTDASFKYPFVGKLIKNEGDGEHLRVSTYNAMKQLLKLHNFDIKGIKGTYSSDMEFLKQARFIEKIMWIRPSLSSNIIFVCHK